MFISKKIYLYPNKEQDELLREFARTFKFVYNKSLDYLKEIKETENRLITLSELNQRIKALKETDEYSWLSKAPVASQQMAMMDLLTAFNRYGKKHISGFPQYKGSNSKLTFYQRTDGILVKDNTHIRLTNIKQPIKCSYIEDMTVKMCNPRVSFNGKNWYLAYSYEIEEKEQNLDGETIGIDLGVKTLATLSNGITYDNINKDEDLDKLYKKKKQLESELEHKRSINSIETNNSKKLQQQIEKIDRKIRNKKDTYMHTVTTEIVKMKPKQIVIEDLDVNSMLSNPYLKSSILKVEFGKFKRLLKYKCEKEGIDLVIANRWYPSSKRCSCCGNVKKTLSLSERTYRCEVCGLEIDRDLNAAINLAKYTELT